jgi:hypothetical protein
MHVYQFEYLGVSYIGGRTSGVQARAERIVEQPRTPVATS